MRLFRALSRPLGASLPSRSSEACIINTFGFDLRLAYFDGFDSSQPLNEKIQRRITDQKSSVTGDIEQHRKESHVRQRNGIGSVGHLVAKVLLSKYHDIVYAFPPDRANQPFGISVLPW